MCLFVVWFGLFYGKAGWNVTGRVEGRRCGAMTIRIKGRGMHWGKDNAEAMIAPGGLYGSNLWSNYWTKQREA